MQDSEPSSTCGSKGGKGAAESEHKGGKEQRIVLIRLARKGEEAEEKEKEKEDSGVDAGLFVHYCPKAEHFSVKSGRHTACEFLQGKAESFVKTASIPEGSYTFVPVATMCE